jgi:hypothetical protein
LGDQAEQPTEPGSPYWLETTLVTDAPAPYFLVQAPSDLVQSDPATLALAWVDFYR